MRDMMLSANPCENTIHCEVALKETSYLEYCSTVPSQHLEIRLRAWLENCGYCYSERAIYSSDIQDEVLASNIHKLCISHSDAKEDEQIQITAGSALTFYQYRPVTYEPGIESLGEDTDESTPAGTHWILPHQELEGLWGSLYFDTDVKERLLQYVSTMALFAAAGVNSSIVSGNRLVLLHGPPGTGKTTLCRALAQKLCIRLCHRYKYGQLIEINSHSLFSKWFSESGKLVLKMFTHIKELIDDRNALVVVLIDEVESLTVARKNSLSGNEPSDAVRVVNALITQIDSIRRYPNVLVLTTSNLAEAVDGAFVDRADLKLHIDIPSVTAVYEILKSCVSHLSLKNIISDSQVYGLDWTILKGDKLYALAKMCAGQLSGRCLRRLPLVAHSYYIRKPKCTFDEFVAAMELAVRDQLNDPLSGVKQKSGAEKHEGNGETT